MFLFYPVIDDRQSQSGCFCLCHWPFWKLRAVLLVRVVRRVDLRESVCVDMSSSSSLSSRAGVYAYVGNWVSSWRW